ncbi:MAG: ABC transporter permease [Zestosphaera sp.]
MPLSLNYLVRRVVWSLLVVVGVVVLSYLIIILSPGDPAVKWAGNPRGANATLAIELARRELGLQDPLYVQIPRFIVSVLTGNLGLSIYYKQPVFTVIASNLASTLELLIVTYLIAIPVGVLLGYLSAMHRGSRIDDFLQQLGVLLANTPTFWLGSALFLILVTHQIPSSGRVEYALAIETGFQPVTGLYLLDSLIQGNFRVFADVLVRLLPPALAVSVYPMGLMIRVVRTLVTDVLLEDYIRVSVALGVGKRRILWTFTLRAVLPGVILLSGFAFADSLVDAIGVESVVFGRPGLGRLLMDALNSSDFRIAIGLIVVVTAFYLVVNTLADAIQALADPRVRL